VYRLPFDVDEVGFDGRYGTDGLGVDAEADGAGRNLIVVLSCRACGRRGSSVPRIEGDEVGRNRLARV
jgi:hypothetical protein